MTDQQRTAGDVVDSLSPDVPVQPASSLLDPDTMRAQGERQDRARQDVIDRANADGGPRLR